MGKRATATFLILLVSVSVAYAGRQENGRQGVNGTALPLPDLSGFLTGAGQVVGQVELGRPGLASIDAAQDSHSRVTPTRLFFSDEELDTVAELETEGSRPFSVGDRDHATSVAGLIISKDVNAPGLAQGAEVWSSYFTQPNATADAQTQRALLGIQHLASINAFNATPGPKIINLSFDTGEPNPRLDGTDQASQLVDYVAERFDTLIVIAGPQNVTPLRQHELAASFNGIVVGRASFNNGAYSQSSANNRPAINANDVPGPRTMVDILAPGDVVRAPVTGLLDPVINTNGSSFAAPLVSGAAALIRERGQFELDNATPGWDNDALKHETLKAVILNSADKGPDVGNGLNLWSARPLVTTIDGNNWFQTPAFTTAGQPLDQEMGVGHLNVARAMAQYGRGEMDANPVTQTALVGTRGWDFHRAPNLDVNTFEPEYVKYTIDAELPVDSVISATLAWDRQPFLNDANFNGLYDVEFTSTNGVEDVDFNLSDSFDEFALPFDFYDNLNLYIVPEGATSIAQAIPNGTSTCPECTTEHLFVRAPATGRYEIWVERLEDTFVTDYALAWWAYEERFPGVPGDLNFDGTIDGSDLQWWALNFGETVDPGTNGDANGDGFVDAADYTVWRDALAAQTAVSASASVPEPSAAILLLACLAAGRGASARLA